MPENNENIKAESIQAFIGFIFIGLIIFGAAYTMKLFISEVDKSGGLKCVLSEFWENGTGKNCGK